MGGKKRTRFSFITLRKAFETRGREPEHNENELKI